MAKYDELPVFKAMLPEKPFGSPQRRKPFGSAFQYRRKHAQRFHIMQRGAKITYIGVFSDDLTYFSFRCRSLCTVMFPSATPFAAGMHLVRKLT